MDTALAKHSMPAFQVCFRPLLTPGHALAFPCDEAGHVDLDALSDDAREDYFFARALVGRDYAAPRVCTPAALELEH